MPYSDISHLPASVTEHLPEHAREIYRAAFNSAWDEYKNPEKRNAGDDSRESTAHKTAWAAVKKKYHKVGEEWKPN